MGGVAPTPRGLVGRWGRADRLAVPADRTSLRVRRELGHPIGFVLFLAAFVLLLWHRTKEVE